MGTFKTHSNCIEPEKNTYSSIREIAGFVCAALSAWEMTIFLFFLSFY
jgi:hypothetical protein